MKKSQRFIIDNLKPYFLDPSLCGYDEVKGISTYSGNRPCVIGKNLIDNQEYKDVFRSVSELLENGVTIFKKSSRRKIKNETWQKMQFIHDSLAQQYFKGHNNNAWILKNLNHIERIEDISLLELLYPNGVWDSLLMDSKIFNKEI